MQQRLAQRPPDPLSDSDGRLRGTADLIAYETKPSSRQLPHDNSGWRGKRLYRVWLYGSDPYAVLDDVKFKPRDDRCILGGGSVPVSVSPTDGTDVRFLWDAHEYDPKAALSQSIDREHQVRMDYAANLQATSLKATFDATPPEMRPGLAEQLRASGIDVPEEWL